MTSLTEELARINALRDEADVKEWTYAARQNSWDYVVAEAGNENIEICQPFHDGYSNLEITQFISAAPDAVALANKLHALLVQAEGALRRHHAEQSHGKPEYFIRHTHLNDLRIDTESALTAIRDAGIGGA